MDRKPIIGSPDILDRIKGAKQRLQDGHALMRVPVDPTDPDCVLADAELEIERLRELLSVSKLAATQGDDGVTGREVLQPLEEPVSISKALLAGRLATVGGNEKTTTAFLVNIQLAPWGASKDWVEGFVDGFNRATKWMQSAMTEFRAAPVEEPTTNALNALRRARDGWHEEAVSLAKRLKYVESDNDLLRKHQSKDVWYFQGDGEDHIESMGNNMVVVIHAHDLRSLIAPAPAQCGCQISQAEFSQTGELKRVTIHYGDSRVAYIVLPTDDLCPRCKLPLTQDCNCDAAYAARAASPKATVFEWPPLPTLPNQSFYAFDRALFTDHQMQGYANAYGEAVRAGMATAVQTQALRTLTDAEIIALNEGEVFFSETPTKFPKAGHGTQYHAGAPGVLKFARSVIALAARPAEQATAMCQTCNGHGLIGGPSHREPGEGGAPCPDCTVPQPTQTERPATDDPIALLIEKHAEVLEGNDYAYFELATRATPSGWHGSAPTAEKTIRTAR